MLSRAMSLCAAAAIAIVSLNGCTDASDGTGATNDEATSANALRATYEGNFRSQAHLVLDVHRTQQAVGRYLGENLGCSQVKLCLRDVKAPKVGLFRSEPGTFELELTASCSKPFSGFRFDMRPAWDGEDYTDALVGYTQNGAWVEKDIVARIDAEDDREAASVVQVDGCDSSPIDTSLPFEIITDPMDTRRF